jgi:hypothetical protein
VRVHLERGTENNRDTLNIEFEQTVHLEQGNTYKETGDPARLPSRLAGQWDKRLN